MTTTITREVADTAAGIAKDIRERGHYQGRNVRDEGKSCIIVNAGWEGRHCGTTEFIRALGHEAGFTVRSDSLGSVYDWNDSTPTAEVLAVLDRMAGA